MHGCHDDKKKNAALFLEIFLIAEEIAAMLCDRVERKCHLSRLFVKAAH